MKKSENNLSFNAFLNKRTFLIVALLLLLMFVLEFSSSLNESQTIDEGVHLTAGYSYLINQKIELNPEHPPFIKYMAALPMLFYDTNFPWTDLAEINQWNIAGQFFYDVGNNVEAMLFWGRLPTMILSLLLGLIIFLWARQLAGTKAGFFALLLYIFDSNILAHSRYITTDIGVSFGFVSTLYFLTKYIKKSTNKNLLGFAFIFSFAQIIKFSALLLWPIIIVFGFFSKLKAKQYFKLIIWTFVINALVIFIAYFGQPYAYYEGIKGLIEHEAVGHFSYLLGEYNERSFWNYFLVAFLIKTPLLTLILFVASISIFINSIKKQVIFKKSSNIFKKTYRYLNCYIKTISFDYWLILSFIAFYFIASIINSINIGIRHLLPIYPFIFIFIASVLYKNNFTTKLKKIFLNIAYVFLIFFIIESLLTYPNYLTYFSPIIGGTSNGHIYLLDSNLDWGQDLLKLKKYLVENNINETIYLDYFGKGSPKYYEINYSSYNENVKEGILAISIQKIMDPYHPKPWLLEHEPIIILGNSIYLYDLKSVK